jgi:beta-N-acetylhexosaminidase
MLTLIDAAAKAGKEVIVLDRPNPIRGDIVEGGFALDKYTSNDHDFLLGFGYPLRHGMTIGEIALMYNDVKKVGANLTVLKMEGWKRSMWYEETGLPWMPPSPNIPTVDSCLYFAASGLMQGADFSLGIATTTPFQFVGDPSWDGEAFANEMNSRNLPGVYFVQKYYQAKCYRDSERYGGTGCTSLCDGAFMVMYDRNSFKPVETQLQIMDALIKLFPDKIDLGCDKDLSAYRMGIDEICERGAKGETIMPVLEQWRKEADEFKKMREKYLLY